MIREQLNDTLLDQKASLFASTDLGISRLIVLDQHLKNPEVSVIAGVRRCGKSTLLRQLAHAKQNDWNIQYINFEDYRLAKFSLEDFEVAYDDFLLQADPSKKNLLLYDEIEHVPGWEKWVSSFSANQRVKIYLTGSNATLLNSELATLLTGRHEKIHVTPFRFSEIVPAKLRLSEHAEAVTKEHAIELRKCYELFQTFGGFPRSYLAQSTDILSQYYEDIILKDIAFRKKVRNVTALRDLGAVLASQNTRLFNRSKIAAELGIKDTNTLSKFCSYFVEAFLYDEIRSFSKSKRKQLRSLAKFYAVDPILAKKSGYHHSTSNYWILENFVFLELKRRYKEIWYWNSEEKFEVDFLVKNEDGSLAAYQVAESIKDPVTRSRELRALEAAFSELRIESAYVITEHEQETLKFGKNSIPVLPFYRWACRTEPI